MHVGYRYSIHWYLIVRYLNQNLNSKLTHCFQYSVHCTYQTIRQESALGNSRFLLVSPTRPPARIAPSSSCHRSLSSLSVSSLHAQRNVTNDSIRSVFAASIYLSLIKIEFSLDRLDWTEKRLADRESTESNRGSGTRACIHFTIYVYTGR